MAIKNTQHSRFPHILVRKLIENKRGLLNLDVIYGFLRFLRINIKLDLFGIERVILTNSADTEDRYLTNMTRRHTDIKDRQANVTLVSITTEVLR